ncbi:MAG: hypothetical protein K9M17_05475 [Mariprofundaceae bacterium]|nr:hypothetical protein [Mariprofundaceae bacterium]
MVKSPVIVDPRGRPSWLGFRTRKEAQAKCAELNGELRRTVPAVRGDYYRIDDCDSNPLTIDDVLEVVRTEMTDAQRAALIRSLEMNI